MFVVVDDDMATGTCLEQEVLLSVAALCNTEQLDAPATCLHDNGHVLVRQLASKSGKSRLETPIQSSGSDHELWKLIPQTAYYIVAIIAAIWVLVVYRRNRRLEQSRWLSTFYDKFYETEKYKRVRELLDSQNSDDIREMVEHEDPDFTDYLNFFEHVAIFAGSKQLRTDDVEASFCYYLDCLKSHEKVRDYINNPEKGFEKLKAYFEARDDHGVLVPLRHLARRWGSR